MKNYFFSDMNVMMGRSMRHITRSMDTIITVCLTPIAMMLLFVYVSVSYTHLTLPTIYSV